MDPLLEAYLRAVEHRLARHLGREHVLSPPDFGLARGWYLAGLPLVSVLAGLDAAFAAGFGPRSLQACRRFVEQDARAADRRAGPAPEQPRDPLQALLPRLEELAARGREDFAACLAEARGVLASGPQADSARRREEFREHLAAAARAALDPSAEQAERRQVERALRRQAALSPPERAAALERHLTRRALERLGLPALL